jgi:hypothetical protein
MIVADTKEKKKFYTKLKSIKTDVETERKRIYRGISLSTKEYVHFAGKKIEHIKLVNYFEVLENRYRIARYCLNKISKECEKVDIKINGNFLKSTFKNTELELIKRKFEETKIEPDFLILNEYFIFAIGSCLDNMSHVINTIYNFRIPPKRISVSAVYHKMKHKRDVFSRHVLKNWINWLGEFKEIRNNMTHNQIIGIPSRLSRKIPDKKITYTKHCLSVNIDNKSVTKELPNYFNLVISNYEKLIDEFYKKVNTIQIETN